MSKHKWKRILLGAFLIIVSSVCISCTAIYIDNINDANDNGTEELEGTIRFVSNRTDKKLELEALISEFEEIHPKVRIELELIGDAEEILQRKATVGELPDITLVPGAIKISEYSKYFMPLDELGFNEDNIYNYASGVGSDGKLYNVDTSITWTGVLYNKEIFKEAGVLNIPRSNKEFFEVCQKIKDIGKVPIALAYKHSWTMGSWVDSIPYLFHNNLEQYSLIEGNNILDKNIGLFKSLNFIRTIVENEYCEEDLLNYEWQQCKNDLRDGKVGMFVWNSNFKYQLQDIGMDIENIGMFPIPETNEIKVFGDYKVAISKNTKYPEVSKEFFQFLFIEDRYADAVNMLSPLKNNEKNKELFEEIEIFNIPIVVHGDTIEYGEDYINFDHEKYDSLRKLTGLNYSFVQEYLVSDDVEALTNDLNSRWNELKNKEILE